MIITSAGIFPKEAVDTFIKRHCETVYIILRASGKVPNVNETNKDVVELITKRIATSIPVIDGNANISISTRDYDYPTLEHKIHSTTTEDPIEIKEVV